MIDALLDTPVELIAAEPTDADLDADPEPDSITHGFSLRPHRWGWAVCIHGDFHRSFREFETARAYLAMAVADWNEVSAPFDPNSGDAFLGHPAQEGGAE